MNKDTFAANNRVPVLFVSPQVPLITITKKTLIHDFLTPELAVLQGAIHECGSAKKKQRKLVIFCIVIRVCAKVRMQGIKCGCIQVNTGDRRFEI